MKKIMAIFVLALMVISTGATVYAQAVEACVAADGNKRKVRCDGSGFLITAPGGTSASTLTMDIDPGNCHAITNGTLPYVLPVATDVFRICAYGNEAYVMFANGVPAATLVVTTGYSMRVKDGQCLTQTITETQAAVIAVATAGVICFNPLVPTP